MPFCTSFYTKDDHFPSGPSDGDFDKLKERVRALEEKLYSIGDLLKKKEELHTTTLIKKLELDNALGDLLITLNDDGSINFVNARTGEKLNLYPYHAQESNQ